MQNCLPRKPAASVRAPLREKSCARRMCHRSHLVTPCLLSCAVKNNWPYTVNDILESEYFIMEEMDFKMVKTPSHQIRGGRLR